MQLHNFRSLLAEKRVKKEEQIQTAEKLVDLGVPEADVVAAVGRFRGGPFLDFIKLLLDLLLKARAVPQDETVTPDPTPARKAGSSPHRDPH